MSIAFTKFQSFVEAMAEKVHNLGADQLMIALCASANAPSAASSTKLSDLTEASYANCSSRVLTQTSSAQSGGVYKLVVNDVTLSASGGSVGPFRYAVLYNNTATNKELVGMYDWGSDVTLPNGGSFVFDFDQVGGVLTVT